MNLKQVISILVLVVFSHSAFGQIDTTKTFVEVILPQYKGGEQALLKLITDSMVYPKLALEDRVGGIVITQFTIDTLGNVINIEIFRGIRDDIDTEAKRLVGLLNGWTPGKQKDGKKVQVRYNLPIFFYPDEKFKRKYKRKHNIP